MKEYNLLIVDDHQIVIEGLKSILQDTSYKVILEAGNGIEALSKLEETKDQIDLLITDISMPLMDGIELCRKVKQLYPQMKVLVLSMYNSISMVKEALSAEADGFILKNSGKDEFKRAFHKILFDGTYYSSEIIPIIYGELEKEGRINKNLKILTSREVEILKLIVKEYTSEEIAEKLFISKKTVDNHRSNILEKTNCRSTIGLVKFALTNGLED